MMVTSMMSSMVISMVPVVPMMSMMSIIFIISIMMRRWNDNRSIGVRAMIEVMRVMNYIVNKIPSRC